MSPAAEDAADPAPPRPRKRARKESTAGSATESTAEGESGAGGPGKKRSRGRPKLDMKDESAADRRRTQIRMAQRAYRSRKENAISALERRVADLQGANDEMGAALVSLHDAALAQGLLDAAPEFGRQLQAATRRFLSLARATAGADDDGEDEDDGEGEDSGVPPVRGKKRRGGKGAKAGLRDANAAVAEGPRDELDRHASHSSSDATLLDSQRSSFDQDVSPATKVYLPGGLIVPMSSDLGEEEIQLAQLAADSRPSIMDISTGYGEHNPARTGNPQFPFAYPRLPRSRTNASGQFLNNPSPYSSLPAPMSYASSETTLSRRLQRTAIERGLRLISMPNPPPARLSRVFGFCLLFETVDMIRERLSRIASATTQDSLHNWGYPFTNLGGAGTRGVSEFAISTTESSSSSSGSSPDQSIFQQPYSMNGSAGEPFKMLPGSGMTMGPHDKRVVDCRDNRLTHDMRIMIPGFEGEFFDPEETELYLRGKGIYVPIGMDEIVVEIDEANFRGPAEEVVADGSAEGHRQAGTAATSSFNQDQQQSNNVFDDVPFTGIPGTMPSAPVSGFTAPFSVPVSEPPRFDMWQRPLGIADFPATMPGDFSLTAVVDPISGQSSFQGHPAPAPSTRKVVTLDIPMFISKLSSTAVCLGRASGFKKQNIDAAVLAAIRAVDTF